jgi:hypothetical protein
VQDERLGYLDPDVAASVGQFTGGAPGRVRISGREVLASTTQLVGATWGEMHRNLLIALTMFYVEGGQNGIAETSLTKLARLAYGDGAGAGGQARFVVSDFAALP